MTDDLHLRRLTPAITDNRIALGRLQIDQAGKPLGRLAADRHTAAFNQQLAGGWVGNANALEITTVEDRADHQFDHRSVVDMRAERETQRRGGILGMGAQLVDLLLTRAFHTDQKTADEIHQHQHADGDKQLLEQRHQPLLSSPPHSYRPEYA